MASGDTKTEAMLNVLGNGGSGDEFRGCCNTKTQQYILDAIDRINSIQPGGSYEAGTGIEIADNTISVDTDTIQEKLTAGTNITIDEDNVISASGGGVKTLTSADYNYPTGNPNSIALWELPAGLYYRDNSVAAWAGNTRTLVDGQNFIQVIKSSGSSTVKINIMGSNSSANDGVYQLLQSFIVSSSGNIADFGGALTASNLKQTTGTSTTDVMSQKAVTDALADVGGFTTLTTEDYNWNSTTGQTGTPNCVALWLLPSGIYEGPANSSIDVRATRIQDYSMGSGFPSYAIVKQYEGVNNRAIVTYFDGGSSSIVEYYSIDENGQNYSTKRFPDVVQSTGTSTTNVMSQKAVTDALASAAIGTTESYTIATNSWSALSASSPYTYSATVTATYTIGNNTIAELINDNAVTFSNYGFAIGSISGQNVTIYSIGQPDASVTLKVNYKG